MAEYIPVEAIQVEVVMTMDGQRIQNVVHYETTDVFTVVHQQEIGAQIVAWWNTTVKPLMPTTVTLVEVKTTDMRTQFAPVVYAVAGLPIVGTNGSPSLPNNCAVVLTKRTLLRGRSFRGRIYWPGLLEGQTTSNQVTPAYLTGYLGAWEIVRELTLTDTDAYMVVVSRFADKNPRVTGITTRVTGFTSDGYVDSQRRRLPGRGA